MSHEAHTHGHPHHEHSHEPKGPWWKQVHRDWRFWTALVLMVAAMAAYVMTVDESLRPGGGVKQQAPAAP
jgi:hypothetical protein